MKKLIFASVIFLLNISCQTKKIADNLPKDISEKPQHQTDKKAQDTERKTLDALQTEIEGLIAGETCRNPEEWRISPIGSKPCGGPAYYIAYPIKLENDILPKIKEYTLQQSAFNKKYHLMSDCAIAKIPQRVGCDNGKAILLYSDMDASK